MTNQASSQDTQKTAFASENLAHGSCYHIQANISSSQWNVKPFSVTWIFSE